MFSAVHSALSGMHAATRRVEASASNIANARNSIASEDARVAPVRRPPPAENDRDRAVYEPVRVHEESVEGGGVRAEYVPYEPPHIEVYAPDDRLADENGMIARPNVDHAREFVSMVQAENAYKANIRTIQTEDEMLGALLDEEH